LLGTDDDARRLEPLLHAVGAEVALLDRAELRVQVDRVVRAGLHAGATADADVAVEVDDPVLPLLEGVDRTDRHARRVRAVVAAEHGEVAADLGEAPLLDVLDPGPEAPDRDVVLLLARDRAGVAADAAAVVDDESVLHRKSWQNEERGR